MLVTSHPMFTCKYHLTSSFFSSLRVFSFSTIFLFHTTDSPQQTKIPSSLTIAVNLLFCLATAWIYNLSDPITNSMKPQMTLLQSLHTHLKSDCRLLLVSKYSLQIYIFFLLNNIQHHTFANSSMNNNLNCPVLNIVVAIDISKHFTLFNQ